MALRYALYRIEQQSIFTATKKDLTPFGYQILFAADLSIVPRPSGCDTTRYRIELMTQGFSEQVSVLKLAALR
jgi:hypothetical protein